MRNEKWKGDEKVAVQLHATALAHSVRWSGAGGERIAVDTWRWKGRVLQWPLLQVPLPLLGTPASAKLLAAVSFTRFRRFHLIVVNETSKKDDQTRVVVHWRTEENGRLLVTRLDCQAGCVC